MQLISVNIGKAQRIENAKSSGQTGIYKQPTTGPVHITSLGLVGDTICDTKHHGGVDQAVYVYSTADYAWWSQTVGKELLPGTFGENLTITELESASAHVGDRLHMGSVVLEVTSPRIPCVTLAARMGDPTFAKQFRRAERPGLYCRVIQEGYVQAGDSVNFQPYTGETIAVIEFFRDFYAPDTSEATLRRYLQAPIAIRDRVEKEAKLAKVLAHHHRGGV